MIREVPMKAKPIIKPQVPETFFWGHVIRSETTVSNIYKDNNRYFFRITVSFSSGKKKTIRRGAYNTKREAVKIRDAILVQIENNDLVVFHYTVREFYDYWLYYYMLDDKKIAYNTFVSYRNVIYNHLLPRLGDMMMEDIGREHLMDFLLHLPTKALKHIAGGILGGSFTYARNNRIIIQSAAQSAIKQCSRIEKKAEANECKSGKASYIKKCELNIPDPIQIGRLFTACRHSYPEHFIALLLAFTTGLRISEILALTYEDIDYSQHLLYVTKQLGRSTNNECLPNGTIATQQIRTKTHHSVRNVPLPQFVIDELILSRARYEKKRNENPYFIDSGYITCHESGLPFNRSYATKPLKALLNECGIPLFHWHDIRHIYATILKDNEIS